MIRLFRILICISLISTNVVGQTGKVISFENPSQRMSGWSSTQDSYGNYYFGGSYLDTTSNVDVSQVFKYDQNFNLIWSFESDCSQGILDMLMLPDGNLMILGYRDSRSTVAKIDTSGNILFSKRIDGAFSGATVFTEFGLDINGNVILVAQGARIAIVSIDIYGGIVFTNCLKSNNPIDNFHISKVICSQNGTIYVCGSGMFQSRLCGFLGALSTTGNLIWAKKYTSNNSSISYSSMAIANNGQIFLSGKMSDSIGTFNSGNAICSHFDITGNPYSTIVFDGGMEDYYSDVIVNKTFGFTTIDLIGNNRTAACDGNMLLTRLTTGNQLMYHNTYGDGMIGRGVYSPNLSINNAGKLYSIGAGNLFTSTVQNLGLLYIEYGDMINLPCYHYPDSLNSSFDNFTQTSINLYTDTVTISLNSLAYTYNSNSNVSAFLTCGNYPTELKDIEFKETQLSIFPNPLSIGKEFFIKPIGNLKVTSLTMHSINGKRIRIVKGAKWGYLVSECTPGIYYLNCIMSNNQLVTKRIVIN